MKPEVVVKVKQVARRQKANNRERNRMHGLNNAMDCLRKCVPLTTHHQKLSKIETLRLARNYITALKKMLNEPSNLSNLEYATILSQGMSQTTTNMIATLTSVAPRVLMLNQKTPHSDSSLCSMSSRGSLTPDHSHQSPYPTKQEYYDYSGQNYSNQSYYSYYPVNDINHSTNISPQ